MRAACCVGRPCGVAPVGVASASLVWPISLAIALMSKGLACGLLEDLAASLDDDSGFSWASSLASESVFGRSGGSGLGFSGGFSTVLVLTGGSGASSAVGFGGGGLTGGVGGGGAGLAGGCGGSGGGGAGLAGGCGGVGGVSSTRRKSGGGSGGAGGSIAASCFCGGAGVSFDGLASFSPCMISLNCDCVIVSTGIDSAASSNLGACVKPKTSSPNSAACSAPET